MPDLDEKLERCFQAVFPEMSLEQARAARAEQTAAWDSTALVTLMSVVEEEFSLSVDPEDLQRWNSFAAIRDYLRDRNAT